MLITKLTINTYGHETNQFLSKHFNANQSINNKYLSKRLNKLILGRALLDTWASANFVTEKFVYKLGIKKGKCSIPVGTLDNLSTVTKNVVKLTSKSIYNAFEKTITCLTVPEISKFVPNEFVKRDNFRIPKNLQLADPNFNKPAPIDLLIGSGSTLSMFCIGQTNLSAQDKHLYALKTRLGWIIGGTPNEQTRKTLFNCHLIGLQKNIKKFWELEEGLNPSYPSYRLKSLHAKSTSSNALNEKVRKIHRRTSFQTQL